MPVNHNHKHKHVVNYVIHQDLLVQQLRVLFPRHKSVTNSRQRLHRGTRGEVREKRVGGERVAGGVERGVEGSELGTGTGSLSLSLSLLLVEVDVLIPELNLAFEFQDAHHYATTWYNPNSTAEISTRDYIKQEVLRRDTLSLVVVPCWWCGDQHSLTSTIQFHRPDLLDSTQCLALPTSLNPPDLFFQSVSIPSVGELMYASFPQNSTDILHSQWWIGEKYDGIRCCWNPLMQKVYSKSGNEYVLPSNLTTAQCMPALVTDGEFWFGRRSFADTYQLVKHNSKAVYWHMLRMVTFDAVEHGIQGERYENRYQLLLAGTRENDPWIIIASRLKSDDRIVVSRSGFKSDEDDTTGTFIDWIAQPIITEGGEGIILQKIGAVYEHGRTLSLLKLKATNYDREGIVIGMDETTQTIHLQLPSGTTFPVAQSSVETSKMPMVGQIVTFSYDSNARRDIPLNPKITRIRHEVTWDEICRSTANGANLGHTGNADTDTDTDTNTDTDTDTDTDSDDNDDDNYNYYNSNNYNDDGNHEYWRDLGNRRKFFEKFARENGFDPLVPAHWYNQPKHQILASKEAAKVMYYHNDSVTRALLDLFPEIGLEKYKLLPSWNDSEIRRKFFLNYANSAGFDPLIAESWYLQSRDAIMDTKGAKTVIFYHSNSITKALTDLFPSIGLDYSRLAHLNFSSRTSWEDTTLRRSAFVQYARDNGFDPLVPENWYLQPRKKIIKGIAGLLSYYSYNVGTALIDCFPDIGLDVDKFPVNPRMWRNAANRRQFLTSIAKAHGFDPLNASGWMRVPRKKILAFKDAAYVLAYHNGKLMSAVQDLFPSIKLPTKPTTLSKATNSKANYSDDNITSLHDSHRVLSIGDSRQFFERYAHAHGIDPQNAEHWYRQSRQKIVSFKGAWGVLAYHKNNIAKALQVCFPNIGLKKSQLYNI